MNEKRIKKVRFQRSFAANKFFIVLFTNHDIYLLFLLTEGEPSKSNKSHYETVCLSDGLYDSS